MAGAGAPVLSVTPAGRWTVPPKGSVCGLQARDLRAATRPRYTTVSVAL